MPVDLYLQVDVFRVRVRFADSGEDNDIIEIVDAECDCDHWHEMMTQPPRERTCPHVEAIRQDLVAGGEPRDCMDGIKVEQVDEDAEPFGPDEPVVTLN